MYEEELYEQEPCEEEANFVICEGVVVPESVILKRQKSNRYGSVEGLADKELADPEELEKQVYREELEPVLRLPVKQEKSGIRPVIEDGHVHWGAFSSVDFDRYKPEFDKLRYKSEKLREQLSDLVIMFKIISARIPGQAKYKRLKHVKMGIMDADDIEDWDTWQLAKLYLRALRIRREITRLEEQRGAKKAERVEAWLDLLE